MEYVVTAYSRRSETNYAYRISEKNLDWFLAKIAATGRYDEPYVMVLNAARLMGTGRELSI